MSRKKTQIAWNGWSLDVPERWHPLRIEGTHSRGRLEIGDGERAVLRVTWWRPWRRFFSPERWLKKRLRSYATAQHVEDFDQPGQGISHGKMLGEVFFTKDDIRSLLYAVSKESGLVVELVSNGAIPEKQRLAIRKNVLPSLRLREADERTEWSLFRTRFETPSAYRLRRSNVMLGDVGLELTAPGGKRLMLRQIYPAGLALSRRDTDHWLRSSPFPEVCRIVPGGDLEEERDGAKITTIQRSFRKSLRAPLHFLRRRTRYARLMHDETRDRLLVVHLDIPRDKSALGIPDLLRGMSPRRAEEMP